MGAFLSSVGLIFRVFICLLAYWKVIDWIGRRFVGQTHHSRILRVWREGGAQ